MSQEQQQIFPYLQRLLNGAHVEWKPLDQVFEIRNGYTPSKKETTYWEGGTIPWYRMEDIRANGRVLSDSIQHITPAGVKGKGLFKANSIIMATTATIGEHALIIADSLANQRFTNFAIRESLKKDINHWFAFYYFFKICEWCKSNVYESSFPSVDMNKLKKLPFPIPPMEVQERIVEILDKFTELQAELALREKQYIYFRDQLLSKDKTERPIRWTPLGKVGSVCMCKRILKNQTSETSGIPFYKIGTFGGTPNAYISKELFERYKAQYSYPNKGDILLSASGTIGRTVIYDGEDAYFQDSNIVWIDHNEETVLNKHLYYCYQIADWRVSKGGTIARLYNKNLLDTTIPIPFPDDKNRSLEEQERIVGILDRFETMVHSIKEGLPREIELRRKQYEYFRDQLLTFPKD